MTAGKINKILIADEVNIRLLKKYSGNDFKIITGYGLSDEEIISILNRDEIKILLIRSARKIGRIFLSRTNLDILCTLSRGTEHIDISYAEKLGIKVINTIEGNADAAAEHTMALILAIYKNLILSDAIVRAGIFQFTNYKRNNLRDKTIGIIGYGQVGRRVGKLAGAFGMNVIANDINPDVIKKNPDVRFNNIRKVFIDSDIISVHIPGTSENQNFISSSLLGLMKPKSVFINTSRGSVIDENYIVNMIRKGKIFGCGLDVFRNEPVIGRNVMQTERSVLSNHVAGKTEESEEFMLKEIILQVKKSL